MKTTTNKKRKAEADKRKESFLGYGEIKTNYLIKKI